jgi:hypothetical protein
VPRRAARPPQELCRKLMQFAGGSGIQFDSGRTSVTFREVRYRQDAEEDFSGLASSNLALIFFQDGRVEIIYDCSSNDDSLTARRASILIATPNAALRRRLGDSLRKLTTVEEAGTGAEALSMLERRSARIVVLDRLLPDLNCDELIGVIERQFPYTDVVLLDGESGEIDVPEELRGHAAYGWLQELNDSLPQARRRWRRAPANKRAARRRPSRRCRAWSAPARRCCSWPAWCAPSPPLHRGADHRGDRRRQGAGGRGRA